MINSEEPKVKVFRFKRVVFGVASSHFLLNDPVHNNHMEGCPSTVAKLMRSMYVNDMLCGASKDMLARGGFNLHKFITKNVNLQN